MRITVIILLAFVISCSGSRKLEVGPGIDLPEMSHRTEIARYFVLYDKLAWSTSDTLMKYDYENIKTKLGPEWFCYFEEEKHHCVYGKYFDGKFSPAVRYSLSPEFRIVKATDGNEDIENINGRLISETLPIVQKLVESNNIRLNWFIYHDTTKKERSIWYIPAMGPNSEIIYGLNAGFVYDEAGEILKKKVIEIDEIKYFIPNKSGKIMIDNKKREIPTIEQIFIAERYREMFKEILIINKASVSMLMINENKQLSWITVVK